jgi:hypothetical protein
VGVGTGEGVGVLVGKGVLVKGKEVDVGNSEAFTPQAESIKLADVTPVNFRKSLRENFFDIKYPVFDLALQGNA